MNDLETIAQKIDEADAILIGASNGLSIAEGYNIFADDERFREVFGDFRDKYGIRCALQGAGGAYSSENEMWSYFGRMAKNYSAETPLMKDLYDLVKDKPYFVLTSNTDGHFQKAGFDSDRILELEGNLNEMYCANHCHDTIYPSEEIIDQMLEHEEGMEIPDSYLPKCPKCGGPMRPHLPEDYYFLEDQNYKKRHQNFQEFMENYHGKKLLILEFGIGPHHQMIKKPLMQITEAEPNTNYITFNKGEIFVKPNIISKSIGVNGDLAQIIPKLLALSNKEK